MTGDALVLQAPPAPSDPAPLEVPGRGWSVWLGPAVSLAILAVVVRKFTAFDMATWIALVPRSPAFWTVFLLYSLSSPMGDWIIFRKLWAIPVSGIVALLRKHVSNHLLLGYLGEIYFYTWARERTRLTTAPFGAIKDVAILSAACGNLVAMAMLPLGIALLRSLTPHQPWLLVASAIAFIATSLVPLALGRMLFSLPRRDLWFVAGVQAARAGAGVVLYAWMWHLLLPADSYLWWIVLAALRQVVTRLPFVPNDDVVFTAIAIFFLGHQSQLADLMVMMGGLSMAFLLVLGMAIGAAGLWPKDPA